MHNIDSPIFIISQHRTGSTLLKNILDAHPKVTMAYDEISLYESFRKDTLNCILKKIKDPKIIVNKIFQKKVYGGFWKHIDKTGIEKEELINKVTSNSNAFHYLKVVLELLKKKNNCEIVGAKYPVHYSHIKELLAVFPTSKIIFLTRNPKGIIASKINDKATISRKSKSFFHKIVFHYFTMFFFLLEYNQISKVFNKYQNNSILITYEDLVENTHETVVKICQYCDIDFDINMLNVSGKKSSHFNSDSLKIHSKSKSRYKYELNRFDQIFIDIFTYRARKRIKFILNSNS